MYWFMGSLIFTINTKRHFNIVLTDGSVDLFNKYADPDVTYLYTTNFDVRSCDSTCIVVFIVTLVYQLPERSPAFGNFSMSEGGCCGVLLSVYDHLTGYQNVRVLEDKEAKTVAFAV